MLKVGGGFTEGGYRENTDPNIPEYGSEGGGYVWQMKEGRKEPSVTVGVDEAKGKGDDQGKEMLTVIHDPWSTMERIRVLKGGIMSCTEKQAVNRCVSNLQSVQSALCFQTSKYTEQVCLHETGRQPPQEESKTLCFELVDKTSCLLFIFTFYFIYYILFKLY